MWLAPRLRDPWLIVCGATAVAAAAIFVIDPIIDHTFENIIASLEYLDTGNIYHPPYGWQVDLPSYLTFFEPVIASFAIAAATFGKTAPKLNRRLATFVLLILSMKHSIVQTLLYSLYEPAPLAAAILSESQFALEALALALLTALSWIHSLGRTWRSGDKPFQLIPDVLAPEVP